MPIYLGPTQITSAFLGMQSVATSILGSATISIGAGPRNITSATEVDMDRFFASSTGFSAYAGYGDIVSTGWEGWWGARAFSVASIGSNAIRVQRSSDSAFMDVATVAGGGLDTALLAWMAGTVTVTRFYDQSGKGTTYDFVVADTLSSTAPAVLTLDGSNKPIITFSHAANTSYQMQKGNVPTDPVNLPQPWSIASYSKRTSVEGSYDWVFACHNDSTNNPGIIYRAAANEVTVTAGPAGIILTPTDNVNNFIGMVANGTSGKAILNSTVLTSQDTGTDTWQAADYMPYLGNRTDDTSTPNMVFYGGGVNSTGISDANWLALAAQDAAYWG